MSNKITVLDIPSALNRHIANANTNQSSFGIADGGWNQDDFAVLGNEPGLTHGLPIKTDYYSVILCLNGSCKKTIGHFVFEVYPNSIHLVSPAYITSFEDASDDLLLYQVLFKKEFLTHNFLKENIVDNLLEVNPDYPPIYGLPQKAVISLKALYEKISDESREKGAFHLQILRLLLTDLLYEMNRACESCLLHSTRHLSKQYQLVYKFKKLVEDKFLTLKTVQEYADELFISAKYLTEIVKNETGQNALHVIHNRMYLEAQYLLSSSGLSIKEIAERLNFDNSSHFSRFFKRFAGYNPTEFKQL
ncbi:helix-turn-helix domain-containing protein [Mucilaginibacter sabulilitoris]|uniref:Helix-turn-helix domain-containing protein n=1 Tax=Mucilaginibacter sabulilitoris TaxID=1173583 RepID=A0ABZ0TR41_9SPHI|nr:helix-turn-helix domain-containing protein [Mucilaginibacter sabulilitoris]WPU95379.1 helix-turn-helix domain-containing protein [Mucilaginibacter sabulilitoris]